MSESMGQIIRKLRKERNLTQEDLAEQLGITYQAVSRWENGTGMPDISQIVPLANVFNVTTDFLFNIEGTNSTEEAYRIASEACSLKQYGKIDTYIASYDLMLDGLKKYPNNMILLNNCVGLGLSLCLPENDYLYVSDRAEEIAAETERQAKLIITHSKSASDIMRAHQILMFLYSSRREYDKASAEVENFPERCDFTFHSNMARINETKGEWENVIKHLCIDNAYLLQTFEDNTAQLGKAYYTIGRYNDAITIYKNWFRIMDTLFGEKFPPFHDFDSGDLYILLAQAYLAVGERDKAIESVEKSVKYYLDMINPNKKISIEFHCMNPPFIEQGITDITISISSMKERLAEKLGSPELESLRDLDRFKILCEKVAAL